MTNILCKVILSRYPSIWEWWGTLNPFRGKPTVEMFWLLPVCMEMGDTGCSLHFFDDGLMKRHSVGKRQLWRLTTDALLTLFLQIQPPRLICSSVADTWLQPFPHLLCHLLQQITQIFFSNLPLFHPVTPAPNSSRYFLGIHYPILPEKQAGQQRR